MRGMTFLRARTAAKSPLQLDKTDTHLLAKSPNARE